MRTTLLALITGSVLLMASSVMAQTRTTGAVRGVITDKNGDAVAGATVVVTSPVLQGQQAESTNADGVYFLASLPPGTYRMTVYFADSETTRTNVLVQLGKTSQVNVEIDPNAGEVIEIQGRPPVIDQGSTKTGYSISEDYTRNIPTGRTFGAVMGSAAGSQSDFYGTSFGGSTSAENVYIIEGVNTTDPAFGLQSTNLPNEFIQETELITGGYDAEYGRATGGVVNVVTKSGGNEFHGSVWSSVTPGALTAAEELTPSAGSSLERNEELDFDVVVGAEVGGPIIEDRLWFHVGVTPTFVRNQTHRIVQRFVDRDGDGIEDSNPSTGFPILEEVGRHTYSHSDNTLFFTSKLTGQITPEHQGSVSFLGNPRSFDWYPTVAGSESANKERRERGAWDVSGKWTSKFNNNKTQVDAVVGWHRNQRNDLPSLGDGDTPGILDQRTRSLMDYAPYETYFGGVPDGCRDDPADTSVDPYPLIDNCPVSNYRLGGRLFKQEQVTDRISAILSATQRLNLAGQHIVKVGLDTEFQSYDLNKNFPGGERFVRYDEDGWYSDRWYSLTPNGGEMCDISGTTVGCDWRNSGLPASTTTRNIALYLQDSWQPIPNLTLKAGLRWESQALLSASEVAGMVSPVTGEKFPETAFSINDMFAPRLGVIYDPTQAGRSKIFGHWGRFYESIPMDINARAFGGEVYNRNYFTTDDCPTDLAPGQRCGVDGAFARYYLGGGDEAVVDGIGGQYVDEVVLGGEYELLSDFKVGASYVRRELGRVIEDISTDNGSTYIIANPGRVDEGVIDQLIADGVGVNRYLALNFDTPTRVYNSLVMTAEKRFTRDLMLVASYTLSRVEGNMPGLFSPETNQLDPNLTSMYDLPELMANRTGPLGHDRTHLLKLDGYYAVDLNLVGRFVFGGSVRATSGIPHNYLASHYAYGQSEVYLLPRGMADRSPMATQFDGRVQYARALGNGMTIEAWVDVFNLFNQQPETDADEMYTNDVTNPIVGGDTNDLAHLKAVDGATLQDENRSVEVNPNFGNVLFRQDPLQVRFGLRLTF
ncbi:TonB-dependent receptor domain-containing protein [Haliangium sp.]|uniref:TonB-dependent receptor domain-containing protein n=1 Tax=Haliangium sp. TaxID=2663208 RepID=UPI003D0D20BA